MSYVRSDDSHDWGKITTFRERLEGEVRIQTGRPFAIFQDRNDIIWGQQWEEAIRQSLSRVTFLVPILTPSFFVSPACRMEFDAFLLKEATLGERRLILPVHYITCEQLESGWDGDDNIAIELRKRNWTDWRPLRLKAPTDVDVGTRLASLAEEIKKTIRDIESIIRLSIAPPPASVEAAKAQATPKVSRPAKPAQKPVVGELRPVRTRFDADYVSQIRRKYKYYAYTRAHDEEIRASTLVRDGEALSLYNEVSKKVRVIEQANSRNSLMVPPDRRSDETRASFAATVLVDNSGSMRQKGRMLAVAAWCTIISQWLNAADVPSEILGYTTRAWKGGQSRERWLMEGKPKTAWAAK